MGAPSQQGGLPNVCRGSVGYGAIYVGGADRGGQDPFGGQMVRAAGQERARDRVGGTQRSWSWRMQERGKVSSGMLGGGFANRSDELR